MVIWKGPEGIGLGFFLFCCYLGCLLEPKAVRWAEPIWISGESSCVGLGVSSPYTSVVRGCKWRCEIFRLIIVRVYTENLAIISVFTTLEFVWYFKWLPVQFKWRVYLGKPMGKTLPIKEEQELPNYISVPGQALKLKFAGGVCHRGQLSEGFGNRCV